MLKKLHRNSQKRFYGPNKIYFITTVTKDRYPYFLEDIFCELFFNIIFLNEKMKKFDLFAFVILYDHVHLLLKPYGNYNISKIMKSIKENFSRDVNKIIKINNNYNNDDDDEGETSTSHLHHPQHLHHPINRINQKLNVYKNIYIDKYGTNNLHRPFKWQASYHDHVIRKNKNELNKYINYIKINPIKHKVVRDIKNYKWIYINEKYV